MDEQILEISEYHGEGYRPLIDFGTWRVAILRWIDELALENINFMERHTQTDEVFVLIEGKATLIVGGNSSHIDGIYPQAMENGKCYNVKQNAWHTIMLSRDALILIVENQDTGKSNSEYCDLTDGQKRELLALSKYHRPPSI